jgi:hypothetical protein
VAIAAFAAVIAGRLRWPAPAPLTEKDTIVLATAPTQPAIRCSTARFEKAFLEQSPFLRLVSDESIHETLRMMGQGPMRDSRPRLLGRSVKERQVRQHWRVRLPWLAASTI